YVLSKDGLLEYSAIPDTTNLCNTSGTEDRPHETGQIFSIRPNPASQFIHIQWYTAVETTAKAEVVISNLQGIEMLRVKGTDASNISVAHLPAGMYMVQALVNSLRKGNVSKLLICR
ncbi:MAG: T9SS type A sorting domain-containing protein, partial [Bacteroidota bacterium]